MCSCEKSLQNSFSIFAGAEIVSSIPEVVIDNKENIKHKNNTDNFIVKWKKMNSDSKLGDNLMDIYGNIKTDDFIIEENETNGSDCGVRDSSNTTVFNDSFYSGKLYIDLQIF